MIIHENGVSFITYSMVTCSASDCSKAKSTGITIDSTITIDNVTTATTNIQNNYDLDNLAYLYVLSNDGSSDSAEGDEVTVIDVDAQSKDETQYVDFYETDNLGVIELATILEGKTLTNVDPSGIIFTTVDGDDSLYIVSNALKLGLIIDLWPRNPKPIIHCKIQQNRLKE